MRSRQQCTAVHAGRQSELTKGTSKQRMLCVSCTAAHYAQSFVFHLPMHMKFVIHVLISSNMTSCVALCTGGFVAETAAI